MHELDHRRIEPDEARLVWETGFWDDETFIEWMTARSGVDRAQAEDMVAFMRSQKDGALASRETDAPNTEETTA